jgi:phenylalanyl-tRNA synthetase beta chain
MKVPLSWLAEHVELGTAKTPHDVMAELVRVGLEEEGAIGGELKGPIVVGEVLEFQEQEQSNGKTIRWCQVRVALDGDESVRGIVCGARNFLVGDKVVVTLPGAELPGGFGIAARKTYGHVSDGMIASSRELGLSEEHDGILRLNEIGIYAEVGTDAIKLLGLDESAAEINVTPDRGYALSIRGVAREFSHATGNVFTDPVTKIKPASGSGFELNVQDVSPIHGVQGCSRFVLLGVEGIDAKASAPDWMKQRLKLAGMRSISIAVDITNYVMLELGQPLHAYDLAKLNGGITVRRAKASEELQTLDGKQRSLDVEDLLITDESGPIGIAGVMGGASTEVSENTTAVILEAAVFDPISIARSARRHKLPSEASKRFERGVDPELAPFAATRAAELLVELAGGKISELGAEFNEVAARTRIEMDLGFPRQHVGVEYTTEQIVTSLEAIGAEVEVKGQSLTAIAPSWRPDLRHKTDLAEEVARLVGYDKIPTTIPVAPPGRGFTPRQQYRRRVLGSLTGAGFVEVLNYPFVSSSENEVFSGAQGVELENPIQSERSQLRRSMLPGLIQAASRNLSRGFVNLALIEEGSVFLDAPGAMVPELPVGNQRPSQQTLDALNSSIPEQPRHLAGVVVGDWIQGELSLSAIEAGYPQMVDAVRMVAKLAGTEVQLVQGEIPGYHPGRAARVEISGKQVGAVGELHPELALENHLPRRAGVFEVDLDAIFALAPETVQAGEVNPMPAATQDISLLVDASVPAAAILSSLQRGAGQLLEMIRLTDDYRGQGIPEGKKSLTFALRFRAKDKTLTQAEATVARDSAVAKASELHGAELRAN